MILSTANQTIYEILKSQHRHFCEKDMLIKFIDDSPKSQTILPTTVSVLIRNKGFQLTLLLFHYAVRRRLHPKANKVLVSSQMESAFLENKKATKINWNVRWDFLW